MKEIGSVKNKSPKAPAVSLKAGQISNGVNRIMVVDDEKEFGELFKETLGREGYSVTTAYTGESALRLAREEKPKLILLDISMPGTETDTLVKKLKTIDRKIIIIFLTGWGDTDVVKELTNKWACGYIKKPFAMDYAKEYINRALREEKGAR